MTKTANILRCEPKSPGGLEEWEPMDCASLVSGTPVQRGHLYHEIEEQGYMVGTWDCTAFTDQMMPYAVDEFMLFLEGDLTMVLPDGEEIKIRAGDAFVIPKGFENSRSFGPLSGSCFEERVISAYSNNLLEPKNAGVKIQICTSCASKGHKRDDCPELL